MARILSVKLLERSLKVTEGVPVRMRWRPNAPEGGDLWTRWMAVVEVGRPSTSGKYHRVPLGLRYAQQLATLVRCPYDGEALLGACPTCRAVIDGPRITVRPIEEHGFLVTREIGTHDRVPTINPLSRGTLIVSREKETLLLVEEREYSRRGTILLLHVEGCSVSVSISCRSEMDRKLSEKVVGEHWNGSVLAGVDRLLSMEEQDRIAILRSLPNGRQEVIEIEIRGQWPRIVSAKVTKGPAVETPKEPTAPAEVKAVETPMESTAPAEVDPIEKTIDEIVNIEGSALEPQSVMCLVRHINDPRHIKRLGGEPSTDRIVEELVGPLRIMARMKPMPEYAGRSFVFRFSGERKLVGDFTPEGKLWVKTLYGRGNPVDRKRGSIDITPNP
jgi:hypothetical protein